MIDSTSTLRAPIMAGHRLGNYRLIRYLGKGATASVFLAEHIFLRRAVALKVLTCEWGGSPDEDLALFEETAAAAARLSHPNIVAIHDIDEDGVRPYVVMEYVRGESVDERLRRRGALPVRQAVALLRSVARGLHHAHRRGVVHCDIKPGNLLVSHDGRVKIADFGLAQMVHRRPHPCLSGVIFGTPAYISPEQVLGVRPGPRSDLYSLGATFFEVLTGVRLYPADTTQSIFEKHQAGLRPQVRGRLPVEARPFLRLLERLLEPRPERRYGSAAELLADLPPPRPGIQLFQNNQVTNGGGWAL